MEKALKKAKDKIAEELENLCKKQVLTKDEIVCMGELVDMAKDISTICGMNEVFDWEEDEGYSGAPYHVRMPRVDYDGTSHRRGRSPSTGRYVSRDDRPMDGYSGHLKKDEVLEELKDAYEDAVTEREKDFIRKMIKKFERKN